MAPEPAQPGRRRRRFKTAIAGIAVAVALVVAVVLSGTVDKGSGAAPPLTKAELASLPKHLAADKAEASQVIDGSIEAKLAALRGVPVVVNQWASWCPSCREEFPLFQQLSRRLRGKVAFLGLDSQDARGSAEAFLRQYPVSYPSIFDHGASQAASIGAGQGWPTTIFFDRRGRRTYVREGGYVTAATLRADVERYALAGRG